MTEGYKKNIRKYRILVVDDDPAVSTYIETILKDDYDVLLAASCEEAKRMSYQEDFQLVLLDYSLPDGTGEDLLKYFKDINENVEIIMVTLHQDVKKAVSCIQLGAFDYIDKEFYPEDLKNLINHALNNFLRHRKIVSLQSEIETLVQDQFVLGSSPKMHKINDIISKAAQVPATVLITGESGTGKEIIARRIHQLSDRKDASFIAVNVAAVPPDLIESTLFGHEKGSFTGAHKLHCGKFEMADNGTLFLDEIGDLRIDLQAKLLRVLQENCIERVGGACTIQVNVRIVAATNSNLEERIAKGKFRDDLYYRLNVLRVHLPPLRERLEDIPELVRHFIKKYNKKFNRNIEDISELVLSILSHYAWPGNIRELENLVERLIVLAEKPFITEGDIPVEYLVSDFETLKLRSPDGDVLTQATEAFERSFILKILESEQWNQTKTAHRLGVHRKTLEYKIKKHDIGAIITQRRVPAPK